MFFICKSWEAKKTTPLSFQRIPFVTGLTVHCGFLKVRIKKLSMFNRFDISVSKNWKQYRLRQQSNSLILIHITRYIYYFVLLTMFGDCFFSYRVKEEKVYSTNHWTSIIMGFVFLCSNLLKELLRKVFEYKKVFSNLIRE